MVDVRVPYELYRPSWTDNIRYHRQKSFTVDSKYIDSTIFETKNVDC